MPYNPNHQTDPIRFSRQISLEEIGSEGQKAISQAKVLVVGAGGLGCPVIQYLSAAGIGQLGIADHDVVELSNLQRQVLYGEQDVGKSKAYLAGAQAGRLNSSIKVKVISSQIDGSNVRDVVAGYDIMVDCTDNFPTRYLLNDACVLEGKTFVYGSIFRFEGQVSVFNALVKNGKRGPNYRDLFPEPPPPELIPDCSQAGVIGSLPGIIGSIQSMEVIKLITGAGEPLAGRLFILDSLTMESKIISVPDQNSRENISKIISSDAVCRVGDSGENSTVAQLTPLELKDWMSEGRTFELIDVREPFERELVHLGGHHFPLGRLDTAMTDLPHEVPIVVYCKSGGRSMQAIQRLREQGYFNLYNLMGGILQWIRDVEPELPEY